MPEIRDIIGEALAAQRRRKPSRRHPAQVTSDRLGDAVQRWGDAFTSAEMDMVGVIRQRLEEIAEGADQ